MPRRCTVCTHERLAEIDEALVAGSSKRRIAADYSLSESAVHRHARAHLPATLALAHEASQAAKADDLLGQVRRQQDRLEALFGAAVHILKAARDEQDHARALEAIRTALQAQREARGSIELLARLLGELQDQAAVQVNLVELPELVAIRTKLLVALEPYPEARVAAATALMAGTHD